MYMNTISRVLFNCRWLILFAVLAVALAAESRYHIIKKIPFPVTTDGITSLLTVRPGAYTSPMTVKW